MENPQYDYAVIGGDMRLVYLTEELAHHQNRVIYYALPSIPEERRCSDAAFVKEACCFSEAVCSANCIIGPIPLSKNKVYLNDSISGEQFALTALSEMLKSNQTFFAGSIPDTFLNACAANDVAVFDLMQDESLSYFNTIATAEGAVCEAITRSPINLHHSRCAVLGYGKCGSTLTSYLKGMFCYVYVCSNEVKEQARASAVADQAGNLEDFSIWADGFDFIFNTIPALVLTDELLQHLKSTVTVIDIASAPGGIDYLAAKRRGISATLCPGLPGKYAPAASASAIRKTIENTLSSVTPPPNSNNKGVI